MGILFHAGTVGLVVGVGAMPVMIGASIGEAPQTEAGKETASLMGAVGIVGGASTLAFAGRGNVVAKLAGGGAALFGAGMLATSAT